MGPGLLLPVLGLEDVLKWDDDDAGGGGAAA